MTDCTFCGCTVEAHDPVFVYEGRGGERGDGERGAGERGAGEQRESERGDDEYDPAGQFCNYACLSAHIEAANLADGATCRLDA